MPEDISRRDILKGTIAGAVGAILSKLGMGQDSEPEPNPKKPRDKEGHDFLTKIDPEKTPLASMMSGPAAMYTGFSGCPTCHVTVLGDGTMFFRLDE